VSDAVLGERGKIRDDKRKTVFVGTWAQVWYPQFCDMVRPFPFSDGCRSMNTTMPDMTRHDQLYQQACALIEGLIVYHDEEPKELSDADSERLQEAIGLFGEVVQLEPENWPALWLLGKIHERLGDYELSLEHFAAAHRLKPDQPDVAREASLAAMNAGRPAEAIPYCEKAIAADPGDPGLRANLALALLFAERPLDARRAGAVAMLDDPEDEITVRIMTIIDEVLNGTRPCPHHVRDLG
jgi:tetratricopeptide (TPR) repeat protein